MTSKAHATLSASGAHKWLNHGPIALLEAMMQDDEKTEASEQGSAAHAMAEHKLKLALGHDSVLQESIYFDEEMETYTNDYVDFVLEQKEKIGGNPSILLKSVSTFLLMFQRGLGPGTVS